MPRLTRSTGSTGGLVKDTAALALINTNDDRELRLYDGSRYLTGPTDLGGGIQLASGNYANIVFDAVAEAAAAAKSAQDAADAAMLVGVAAIVEDGGTFVIDEEALLADLIFKGDGTLTLPTVLVAGRRFYVHVHLMATGKTVQIPTGAHTITGNIGTIPPANTLELIAGDVIVLEVVSTTELEIL
jgi:hypothetical protein